MNKNTRELAITALLTAITFLVGLTPIGYIPIPGISMTILCIPVIIGTITEGLKTGLWISLAFGVTSFLKALGVTMVPDPLGTFLLQISVVKTLIVIFIPRLLIPVTTWLVYNAITGESKVRLRVATGIGAFVGSITNTILFLGSMYLVFLPEIGQVASFAQQTPETFLAFLVTIGAMNGLPEAVLAVALCIPIVAAVMNANNKRKRKTER